MRKKGLLCCILAAGMIFVSACGKKTETEGTTGIVADQTVGDTDTSEEKPDEGGPEDGGSTETSSQEEGQENKTLGTLYKEAFLNSVSVEPNSVVNDLIGLNIYEADLVPMLVTPGYLNGFDYKIQNFKEGMMFSPMIGSIPFVGYVFKTDTPDELIQELKGFANLAWNVCTEADEMVYEKKDNLVFFMMCRNEE